VIPRLLAQAADGLLQAHVEAQPFAQVVTQLTVGARAGLDARAGALRAQWREQSWRERSWWAAKERVR
jgi:hypothetical protein